MFNKYLSALIALVLAGCPLLAQEGKLEKVRKETKHEEAEKPSSKSTWHGDPDEEWAFGLMLVMGAAVPYIVPYAALGDDFYMQGTFLKYPYASRQPGSMFICRNSDPSLIPPETDPEYTNGRDYRLRFSFEESNDFDGLNRVNGSLLLDTALRLGLQTSWSYFHENLTGGKTDSMTLGDVNVVFRFAQNEWAQFRSGLGFRVSADQADTVWGFNFTYSADFFPCKPLVISAQTDLGTLGDAGVFHGRLTAGALWSRWEISGGYDFLRIGSVNLQGPVLGVRCWF